MMDGGITKYAADLAPRIMISAQETTPGQYLSRVTLASSTISIPAIVESFFDFNSEYGPSSNIDASHP